MVSRTPHRLDGWDWAKIACDALAIFGPVLITHHKATTGRWDDPKKIPFACHGARGWGGIAVLSGVGGRLILEAIEPPRCQACGERAKSTSGEFYCERCQHLVEKKF